mmetsp:Transcript_71765/g.124481  ORF Transcript_71765/g.124481 Transcript_71765/m.124481 type:complete len:416 (-) Transcript_71765:225-1472(-)
MATVLFIDDLVPSHSAEIETAKEGQPCKTFAKPLLRKLDDIDDGATTDVGQSSASETEAESSSGVSSDEGIRRVGRHCRFGTTPLETIPATPTVGTMSLNSPPGLSRGAMRAERDAFKHEASADCSNQNQSSGLSEVDAPSTSGVTLSRFGTSQLGTVPKTPVGKAKLKNLQSAFGSPPGLSRAEKRRARDAWKGAWGSYGVAVPSVSTSGAASMADRQAAAHQELSSMKERAAFLKVMKASQGLAKSEAAPLVHSSSCKSEITPDLVDAKIDVAENENHTESSEAEPVFQIAEGFPELTQDIPEVSVAKERRCHFDGTAFGTMPSTPKEAMPSPPGLSRKAMRQARDSCRKTSTLASTSWGTVNSAALTISPAGKPMTPPAQRAAKQRAARDAVSFGWESVSMPSLRQTSGVAR